MAEDYTQFSTMISNLTDSEKEWCKNLLEEVRNRSDEEVDDEGDCEIELTSEENGLWIYASTDGDVSFAASVIQRFLKECRPNDCYAFEWAWTCSKLRLDEFSGGGVFITATDMKWFIPEMLISEAFNEWVKNH